MQSNSLIPLVPSVITTDLYLSYLHAIISCRWLIAIRGGLRHLIAQAKQIQGLFIKYWGVLSTSTEPPRFVNHLQSFSLICRLFLGTYSPKKSQKVKYSTNVSGGYSSSSFKDYRLPTSIVTALVNASNQSLALSTWSSYRTAENHLRQCEIDTNVKIRFPMDDRK